jgi:hypothetical protein
MLRGQRGPGGFPTPRAPLSPMSPCSACSQGWQPRRRHPGRHAEASELPRAAMPDERSTASSIVIASTNGASSSPLSSLASVACDAPRFSTVQPTAATGSAPASLTHISHSPRRWRWTWNIAAAISVSPGGTSTSSSTMSRASSRSWCSIVAATESRRSSRTSSTNCANSFSSVLGGRRVGFFFRVVRLFGTVRTQRGGRVGGSPHRRSTARRPPA